MTTQTNIKKNLKNDRDPDPESDQRRFTHTLKKSINIFTHIHSHTQKINLDGGKKCKSLMKEMESILFKRSKRDATSRSVALKKMLPTILSEIQANVNDKVKVALIEFTATVLKQKPEYFPEIADSWTLMSRLSDADVIKRKIGTTITSLEHRILSSMCKSMSKSETSWNKLEHLRELVTSWYEINLEDHIRERSLRAAESAVMAFTKSSTPMIASNNKRNFIVDLDMLLSAFENVSSWKKKVPDEDSLRQRALDAMSLVRSVLGSAKSTCSTHVSSRVSSFISSPSTRASSPSTRASSPSLSYTLSPSLSSPTGTKKTTCLAIEIMARVVIARPQLTKSIVTPLLKFPDLIPKLGHLSESDREDVNDVLKRKLGRLVANEIGDVQLLKSAMERLNASKLFEEASVEAKRRRDAIESSKEGIAFVKSSSSNFDEDVRASKRRRLDSEEKNSLLPRADPSANVLDMPDSRSVMACRNEMHGASSFMILNTIFRHRNRLGGRPKSDEVISKTQAELSILFKPVYVLFDIVCVCQILRHFHTHKYNDTDTISEQIYVHHLPTTQYNRTRRPRK